MKYFKAGIAAALLILFGVLSFRFAQAQDPGSDSSETVAKPRKKNLPPATAPVIDSTEPSAPPANTPEPAAAPPSNTAPPDDSSDEPKIPSKFSKKNKELPADSPTFTSDTSTVELDVAVLDNKGHFLPGIPKNNFRVLEDNVPQKIASFNLNSDAPMTVAMVIEFSNLFQQYYSQGWFQTLTASYGFVETLKPDDYVAVIAYDLRPEILCDFTTDRQQTAEAMSRLRIAGFSESSLFDALTETAQRMQDIEGRKAIVLIASGIDTLSKLTFDKARRAVQDAGVPIYTIGLMQSLREMADASGAMGTMERLDFIQADNEMRTFAAESGGMSYFPRFDAEFPGIFQSIEQTLRSDYVITYNPS